MSGREQILGKIRQQIGGDEADTKRRAAVANRLSNGPRGVIPKRGQLPHPQQIDLFCSQAEAVQSSVVRVVSYKQIPETIAEFLRANNLPSTLRMGEDDRLANVPWDAVPNLERAIGAAIETDTTGLSHAMSGVAETGTLVLTSGNDNPTSVNFLPENHIVVIQAKDIVGDYETALDHIRKTEGKGRMPRTINMITGPSRSGDIEQTMLLGAHGPRKLHIIVVDG
ncbi:MAG: lactate utilization protein [Hyphomicrobiales bacterium]|nr:MAG: lactate utilization protein [Hyphomicrobiales bacterium]